MFVVKRYTNDKGESTFIPTFNGKPAQDIPQGFTEAQESRPAEGSAKILQRAGLGARPDAASILQSRNVSAKGVLSSAGIQPAGKAPEPSDAFKQQQETLTQTQTSATDQTQSALDAQKESLKDYMPSTEPPDTVTAASMNHLISQLRTQYDSIKQGSGYRYKNEKELDLIFSAQAAKLAVNGINDIRDIGVEEVEQTETIKRVYKKGDKYYYTQLADDEGGQDQEVAIDPAKIKDIREIEETIDGDSGPSTQKRIEVDVLTTPNKFLINKVTGKRLDYIKFTSDQFRKDLATKGEFSTSLAGSKGTLPLQDRGGFNRWGHQLDVDGQADYAVEFVDGNFITMPVWKDTKTDLTPLMMMASAVLMAYGVPGQIGGALTPAGTLPGTQLAVGNAVVAGGMTALGGGDFEDIAKAAVLSGGMTYASAYVPAISKTIGEAIVGVNAPGAMTVGTAITNAGLNGIAAVIMGQDPTKAMVAGAVQGVVRVNASDFLKSTFGEDTFQKLSSATNLDPKEMESLVVRSLSKGAGAMAYNKNFFTSFRDSLVSEGVSLSLANSATSALSKNPNLDKEQLNKIHKTVRTVAQVSIVAKQRGLNPKTVLESMYPKIILNTMKK